MIGLMKDELGGKIMAECVAMRHKTQLLIDNGLKIKKRKA